MWKYYFEKDKVTLEVLSLYIKDHQTFDANINEISFKDKEVVIDYNRELSSLEEVEISGYVNQHISVEIVTKGKYIKHKYRLDGKIESENKYLNKNLDGELITLLSKKSYIYNDLEELTGFTIEKYDLLEQPYERTLYSVYSDPLTGEMIIMEDLI